MLIAITGNIASGKSTLADALHRATGYDILAIDEYRKRYNPDSTWQTEKMLWRWVAEDVERYSREGRHVILEMTGASQSFHMVLHASKRTTVVRLRCSQPECWRRYQLRSQSKDYIPSPVPFKSSIRKAIADIDTILQVVGYDIVLDSETNRTDQLVDKLRPILKDHFVEASDETPC